MATLYALMVGINTYPEGINNLRGCVNDINLMETFLKECYSNRYDLNVCKLENSQATRGNIIRGFRGHLGRAQKGDFVLFQYSGHGSWEHSAPQFRNIFPIGRDETIVCYDSRITDDSYDLADKELAVLLSELHPEAHIVVLADCCHSGSLTREPDDFHTVGIRYEDPLMTDKERPLETYLDGYYTRSKAQSSQQSGLIIPTSSHILLAACKNNQRAREDYFAIIPRPSKCFGIFTWHLVKTLRERQGEITYREAFTRTRGYIKRRKSDTKYYSNQDPSYEIHGDFNAYHRFLENKLGIDQIDHRLNYNDEKNQWEIEFGMFDGIEKGLKIEIYNAADLKTPKDQISKFIAKGTIREVQFGKSVVEIDQDYKLNYRKEYRVIIPPPNKPTKGSLEIFLTGEEKERQRFINYTKTKPFLSIDFYEDPTDAKYELHISERGYKILNRETGKEIVPPISRDDPDSLNDVLLKLKHIQRWESIAFLKHSTMATINPKDIDLTLCVDYEDGKIIRSTMEGIHVDCRKRGNEWLGTKIWVEICNKTSENLQVLLLYCYEGKHYIKLYCESGFWVPPDNIHHKLLMVKNNDGIKQDFAFLGLSPNENEDVERFVAVIARSSIDLNDVDFLLPPLRPTREADSEQKDYNFNSFDQNWIVKSFTVRVIRQIDQVGKKNASLAAGKLTIKSHPQLQANVALLPAHPLERDSSPSSIFSQHFEGYSSFLNLLDFSDGGRDVKDESPENLQLLELSNIQNHETVTPDQPLEIRIREDLGENEVIIPVAFDGETFLPLGCSRLNENGTTVVEADGSISINLIQLPAQDDHERSGASRSLTKALKLCFCKVVVGKNDVNQLRWVEFNADGSVERHSEGLKEKVAKADNILLLIHGIIGDTHSMAKGISQLNKEANTQTPFDLTLTYDYENLRTSISETAQRLKVALQQAGIHENQPKRLTIVAHSMGGLVSRWLIEKEGGSAFVKRLVMAGTPNNGSLYGDFLHFLKLGFTFLSYSLSYAPLSIPFAAKFIAILTLARALTPTLKDMAMGSSKLIELNSSSEPDKTVYDVIAGNIFGYQLPKGHIWQHLDEKLLINIGKTIYGNEPNDIAVSVASISGVGNHFIRKPDLHHVNCHHLNYFEDENALNTLSKILGK